MPERVGVGEQSVVAVVLEAGHSTGRVDLADDLGTFVDHVAAGVAQ